MQLSQEKEISYNKGLAARNFGKLERSGIIKKIEKYKERGNHESPLKIKIKYGNPQDAYVLIQSIIGQADREELCQKNRLPKGYTKSPKIGARNFAMYKGRTCQDPACFVRIGHDNITIEPEGVDVICGFIEGYMKQIGLKKL